MQRTTKRKSLVPIAPLLAFVTLITASACAPPRVLIRSAYSLPPHGPSETAPPRGPLRTVAVVALHCNDKPDGAENGDAHTIEDILSIPCGVQMSTVEGALNNAGLRVLSSRSVKDFSVTNQLTYDEAALAMGADSLVEINALETVTHNLRELQISHAFIPLYKGAEAPERTMPADSDGSLGQLAKGQEEYLAQFLSRSGNPAQGRACGASLNVKIVGAKNHVAQWFFRSVRYAPLPMGKSVAEHRRGTWASVSPPEVLLSPCSRSRYEQMVREVCEEMALRLVGR